MKSWCLLSNKTKNVHHIIMQINSFCIAVYYHVQNYISYKKPHNDIYITWEHLSSLYCVPKNSVTTKKFPLVIKLPKSISYNIFLNKCIKLTFN